ncbi:MAG: 2-keto-4-pentenoate hydratase [Candidatus Bathyarchaeia archaeon]
MSVDFLRASAKALFDAEANRAPIQPLTADNPSLTVEDAYRIQSNVLQMKKDQGERIVGKKIGLTSKAIQTQLGVFEPDYGQITHKMVVADGSALSMMQLIKPKVEAEVAFILKQDLQGPSVTTADVLRATEGVMPVLEIIDSRIRDWKIKIQDTIADNASSARVVTGGALTALGNLQLNLIGAVFEKNGGIVATGAGAAVLGHPAHSVAWLANKLSEFGEPLRAGEIVLSGSLTAAVDASAGDVFRVSFDRLGSVAVRFTA